jgi:hypothetical protein
MIKISRTGVEQYMKCPRCFVLQYKHRIRLDSLPFTLNSAVDNLCKNEFDHYRKLKEPHPMFKDNGIDAVPFDHPKMDEWRENFKGIRYINEEEGYNFGGAVDDVWQKPNGELIISDVKSTAKKVFDWDKTWSEWDYPKAYKRQLEIYQWLFRRNGFEVAKEAYLVYFNGLKNEPFFNQELKFELHVIKLDCDDSWVEEKLLEAVNLLKSDEFPPPSESCDVCSYLKKRWNFSQKAKGSFNS